MVETYSRSRSQSSSISEQQDGEAIGAVEKGVLALCALVLGCVPLYLYLFRDYGQ